MNSVKAAWSATFDKLRRVFFRCLVAQYQRSLAGEPGQHHIASFYHWLRDNAHEHDVRRVKEHRGFHPSVRWGLDTLFYGDGNISIGTDTYLGRQCFVVAHPKDAKISIGAHCAISHNVHIRTQKHRRVFHLKDEMALPSVGEDIVIRDHVWIGANAFIGSGVTIGENSIVGANSVVTRDIPANSVCGGVPARVLWSKESYASAAGGDETAAGK